MSEQPIGTTCRLVCPAGMLNTSAVATPPVELNNTVSDTVALQNRSFFPTTSAHEWRTTQE